MCFISIDDCEPFDVLIEKQIKARKSHKCSSCGGVIFCGEKYTKHFSKFEGEIESSKCCAYCEGVRVEFGEHHEGIKPTPANVRDMLIDCISEADENEKGKWKDLLAQVELRKYLRHIKE